MDVLSPCLPSHAPECPPGKTHGLKQAMPGKDPRFGRRRYGTVGNLYVEVATLQRAVAGELRGQINNQARSCTAHAVSQNLWRMRRLLRGIAARARDTAGARQLRLRVCCPRRSCRLPCASGRKHSHVVRPTGMHVKKKVNGAAEEFAVEQNACDSVSP